MLQHTYSQWYKAKFGKDPLPDELPDEFTVDGLTERLRRRLNSFWELRAHRLHSYLGMPSKARSKGAEKERRLRAYKSYVEAGGLMHEVSISIINFQ